ncbi:MAG: DUF1214 domain-containing protein [Myxococcota bacterium]|nr:DUF1214 domain-containing protein [Myxococcota bacterium]
MSNPSNETRKAFRELLDLLQEADERWVSAEWGLLSEAEHPGAHRALMHILETGLVTFFENDPDHPRFRRIVSPSRKLTGDNSDAIYFDAPVRPGLSYRVRGRMDDAVYVSFTIEADTEEGRMGTRTLGVLNDTMFDVDAEGRFELFFGGEPRQRNWLALQEGASRITTRHYYEEASPAAANARHHAELEIEVIEDVPPAPPPDDASVAAGIRRVVNFVRSRTLDMEPMARREEQPPFVSIVPNEFPKPMKPGDFGLAAFDAAYSMAPYAFGPDQALVVRGRWPADCRMANVCLWTRHMQTYDYTSRPVSLNRVQTRTEPDGSFRIVLAHRDPGVPNWLDTEGRPFGLVFFRYMLPEGDVETPVGELVDFASIAKT